MSKDDRELIELKPCPFCGENMAVMATWISNAPDSAEAMEAPVCPCGAQGPMYPTRRLAANAWNIRAATRLEALQAQPAGEAVHRENEKYKEGYRTGVKQMQEGAPEELAQRLLALKRTSASIYGPLIDQTIAALTASSQQGNMP